MKKAIKFSVLGLSILLFSVLFTHTASADHAWGTYHWARTENPFTLVLGDNVAIKWDAFLATTSTDWSVSSVLDTTIKVGKTTAKTCKVSTGRVEVCNSRYGNNGWLGIAQIWVSGSHITKGVVKMNDTYFDTTTYNTTAWRNLVMCQEVGHTLGLDHQDEDFNNQNLDTCMDYTSAPESNQHPNDHDYEQLLAMYTHADSFNSMVSSVFARAQDFFNNKSKNDDLEDEEDWGKPVLKFAKEALEESKKKNALYVKELSRNEKVFTHVFWVEEIE